MILYLDTSALLKLYAEERGTTAVRAAVARASVVATSRLTYVEARGAFARKFREGDLPQAEHQRLISSLDEDWGRLVVVEMSEHLCQQAVALVERHPLRAGDALQLASACAVRDCVEDELAFSSLDDRLNMAAELEGLAVLGRSGQTSFLETLGQRRVGKAVGYVPSGGVDWVPRRL